MQYLYIFSLYPISDVKHDVIVKHEGVTKIHISIHCSQTFTSIILVRSSCLSSLLSAVWKWVTCRTQLEILRPCVGSVCLEPPSPLRCSDCTQCAYCYQIRRRRVILAPCIRASAVRAHWARANVILIMFCTAPVRGSLRRRTLKEWKHIWT